MGQVGNGQLLRTQGGVRGRQDTDGGLPCQGGHIGEPAHWQLVKGGGHGRCTGRWVLAELSAA